MIPETINEHPGDVLAGRYEIVSVLGQGAFGQVLEVLDRSSGSAFALKRIPPEVARDTVQMHGIKANYNLVKSLTHPHIATTRMLEVDSTRSEAYVIMD